MNEIVMEITPEMEGERIDKCISNYLESLSRSYIQKIIKDGKAYVNDAVVKANYKVKVDDKVQFEIPDCEEPDIPPQDIPLDILYEDKDILIFIQDIQWYILGWNIRFFTIWNFKLYLIVYFDFIICLDNCIIYVCLSIFDDLLNIRSG